MSIAVDRLLERATAHLERVACPDCPMRFDDERQLAGHREEFHNGAGTAQVLAEGGRTMGRFGTSGFCTFPGCTRRVGPNGTHQGAHNKEGLRSSGGPGSRIPPREPEEVAADPAEEGAPAREPLGPSDGQVVSTPGGVSYRIPYSNEFGTGLQVEERAGVSLRESALVEALVRAEEDVANLRTSELTAWREVRELQERVDDQARRVVAAEAAIDELAGVAPEEEPEA